MLVRSRRLGQLTQQGLGVVSTGKVLAARQRLLEQRAGTRWIATSQSERGSQMISDLVCWLAGPHGAL
jgi:hypothetical protein